ncbi:helix-turn-helix transcriptional regulator [Actinoplanes sp. RD1]|uniref:helix-turn-helix transcriptional regulator n=1 Tax=Actinoplanes sp. RD1 TaxID=3064538 RepID=UPI0027408791|nr:helix-turn-helix transcriptional regulator [Actinoplanes sp. RD1]
MDRRALAAFLRGHRERISPGDVGLPAGTRRRTPGLRREEVAQLAMISVDHYSRLEQGRSRHPSRAVLNGIARALRLSGQEREHLFRLAGQAEARSADGPDEEVPAGTLQLVDRMTDAGVVVLDGGCRVLAWNPLAAALFEDFSALGAGDRNIVRRYFLHPDPSKRGYGMGDSPLFARTAVSYLRVAATRYPHHEEIHGLIRDLLAASPEFAGLWRDQEVHIDHHSHQVIEHPAVGRLELDFEVLTLPGRDQQVVMVTAEPGSPVHRALELLRVIGTQDFSAPR